MDGFNYPNVLGARADISKKLELNNATWNKLIKFEKCKLKFSQVHYQTGGPLHYSEPLKCFSVQGNCKIVGDS